MPGTSARPISDPTSSLTPPPTFMRAGVLTAPLTANLCDAPLPMPGPNQVRIKLAGCGVCGSNLPVWEGRPWFEYPRDAGSPGHEGWGTIDAVGAQVRDLAIGDWVTALSYQAFAEFDLADAAQVVRIPSELAGRALPGEPLGCAMNVVARADLQPGQTVAIVGIGFLGALLVRLAKNCGARVIAISRRATARDAAAAFGADEIFTLPDNDFAPLVRQIHALTAGQGCDRVIEATGNQAPLTLAGELVRTRGKLVIAGYHQDGPREINLQQWNWQGLDVINAHERDPAQYVSGMRAAIDAILAGQFDPSPLYTHTFPLRDLAAALEQTARRPAGFMKALVTLEEV